MKSPLRYPGGKSKAIKFLDQYIPYKCEYREPFVGGGSVFLHAASNERGNNCWINDINQSVMSFWITVRDNHLQLVKKVTEVHEKNKDGRKLYESMRSFAGVDALEEAVRFFVLNRITFSGTTEAGGYSQSAFDKRFTESSIKRLSELHVSSDVKITSEDYSIMLKKEGNGVCVFLDPPYFSNVKSGLYGKGGKLHSGFDHEKLSAELFTCEHDWFMTIDDCDEIRDLYSWANIREWELQYGMNNVGKKKSKKGKELVITNK